jgi:hypothetical protein
MEAQVQYLLSLRAIRERAKIVGDVAKSGELSHFDLHEDRLTDCVDFVLSVIKVRTLAQQPLVFISAANLFWHQRDFGPDRFDAIPPHGRWQHFEVGKIPRISNAMRNWKEQGCSDLETTRRLVDLFFVSVLLDAGAGDHWRYTEPGTNEIYERSEGIAVASLHMFNSLAFSAMKSEMNPMVDGNDCRSFIAVN